MPASCMSVSMSSGQNGLKACEMPRVPGSPRRGLLLTLGGARAGGIEPPTV